MVIFIIFRRIRPISLLDRDEKYGQMYDDVSYGELYMISMHVTMCLLIQSIILNSLRVITWKCMEMSRIVTDEN